MIKRQILLIHRYKSDCEFIVVQTRSGEFGDANLIHIIISQKQNILNTKFEILYYIYIYINYF